MKTLTILYLVLTIQLLSQLVSSEKDLSYHQDEANEESAELTAKQFDSSNERLRKQYDPPKAMLKLRKRPSNFFHYFIFL